MPFIEDIEVETAPRCPACESAGELLYTNLRDHTFGAPGTWRMKRCPSCTLMWLDPRPTPGDIGKIYQDYYTHGLTAQGSTFATHVKPTGASRLLVQWVVDCSRRIKDAVLAARFGYSELSRGRSDAFIANTLGLLPGVARSAALEVLGLKAQERGKLLDVGSGNGVFLGRMKSLGWECTGLETDTVAADFAREQFGLEVKEGMLADAGFANDEFDVVTLSHVIEHVHSPLALLMECKRILRPGGRLIVLTPNTRSLGHRIFRRAWRGLEPPRHLLTFHPNALRTCVDKAGMRTLHLTTEARMMRSIWYASRLIQRAEQGSAKRNGILDYLLAYSMQAVETMACLVFKDVGEEVMLVAVKPTAT